MGDTGGVSITQATAEVFATAIKSLKRRERETLFERPPEEATFSRDFACISALTTRRRQPRQPFPRTLKRLSVRA